MSALLVFSMWPTGATRALAEAIAPQDSQEAVEEVYEPEAQEQQAVAEDQAVNETQAADEAQAAAAAAEAERAAAEQAAADQAAAEQAAADQAAADQAAAEAEANRQVNVGIDVPNATLHYNGQAFTAPTESITVPAHAAFVFSVAPMAGYDLKAVKTLVNGQETELHADAQGLYTVSEATLDSNVTVKVVTEPTAQSEPAPAPEVVAPAGDASQGQDDVAAPADEPKTDEDAADTIAPSEGSATTTEGQTPAGDTAAVETGNGETDVNAAALVETKTITVGQSIELTSTETSGWYTHTWSTNNADVATVSNSDSETVTVTGVASGTAIITDTYTPVFGTGGTNTYNITVVLPNATGVEISGKDTVGESCSIQLTAVTNPANAGGTASWASSNDEVLTVDQNGKVTGHRQDTATVEVTFTNADGTSVTATKDITVVASTAATSVSISGENSVTQFSTLQLAAVTDPANADGTASWASSNEAILTVDENGLVTGHRQGTATVSLTFANADGTSVMATKDITVEAVTEATDQAGVYYLLDPTKDANSNDTGHWGPQYGLATVNVTGATWSNDKNCFDNVDQRVVSWPNGTNVVPRGSEAWNQIYENYKSVIQAQLPGVDFTKDDVEEISLVPAKISKNNQSNPDKHLDCNVSIKCKGVALVKYYLRDADSTQFALLGSQNYVKGDKTNLSDVYNGSLPDTKVVNGVTYTFSGWYLDQNFTQPVTLPYTVNDSTNFYAKYVGGYQVIYDLAGGTWGSSDATMYTAQEGSTQTVRHEPTLEGFKFAGWTVTGLDDVTTLKSGATFTMPSHNVTLTATWEPLVSYQVKYLENGTETELAPADTRYGELGKDYTETAKTIDGYHLIADCPAEYPHKIGEGDNTVIFLYEKDSVAYTVNYYLNGTETKVADSDTKYAPWGSVVSAADCAKDIAGYTAVDGQDATITVERSGSNVIDVYYYRNVTLTANSDTKTYNGSEQSVSGFTGAPEGADFSAITVGAAGTNVGTYGAIFAKGTVGTVDATGKYIVTEAKNGGLLITPYAGKIVIKIKGATDSKTYNGTEQSVEGFTVESISTKLITEDQVVLRTDVAAKATGTNVGTYNMGLAGTSFTLADGVSGNFASASIRFDVTDGALTITKRPVTLKSADLSKEYDGTPLVNGATPVKVSGDGWVEGEGASYAFTGTQTAVGSSANAFTYTLNSNTKTENYTITKTNGTLTVKDRAEKYQVTIKANSATVTYDGKTHEAKGLESTTVIANGHTFTVEGLTTTNSKGTGAGAEGIDAGEYTNHITGTPVIKDAAGNDVTSQFEVTTVDGKLTIAKRDVRIKPVKADKEYDGTALVATDFEVVFGSFAEGEGIESCTYGGQQIQVGSSESTIETVKPKANTNLNNYNLEKGTGALTVTDRGAKYEIKVEAKSDTFTYNGEEHIVSGLVTDKFTIDGVTYVVSGLTAKATRTDVGERVNYVTGTAKVTDPAGNDVTKQFAVKTESGKLTIAPRPVTLTSASDSKVFDGTALTNDEVTVSGEGFVKGQGATFDVTGFQTVVGESNNTFTYALNEGTNPNNYSITTSEGTLKVTANEQAVVVKVKGNTNTQLYDGAEHVATGYTIEGVTVDGVASDLYGAKVGADFKFKGTASAKRTDAGKTDMGLKAEQFENINKNFSNVTFEIVEDGSVTITKRAVTLTSASAYKTYDGTALVKDEVTVSGDGFVMGQGATYSVTGSQTNAGESFNTFSYTLNKGTNADNYTITTHEGTLVVNPVMASVVVTIVGNHADGTYNGKELSASGYTFSSNNELYTQDKAVFTGTAEAKRTDAGKTDMGLKASQFSNGDAVNFKNVVFKVSDGYVDIAKAQVTLKSADLFRQYNGTALVNGTAALEIETGWVEGEGATYTFTGSQTVVGSSPNAFTYTLNEGTKAGNYNIDKTEGTLTVMNRDAKYEVTVKANSATVTYDGKAHEAAGVETDTFVIDGATYTVSGLKTENPSKVDAGTYTNNITGTPVVKDADGNDVTRQFTVETENGKLVINQAEVTLTSASGEWTYDGTKHTKHEMETVSGFAEGEGATFTYSASITNVGNVENAFVYKLNANTKSSNYRFTTNNGTLKVTPVTDKVTVTITGNSATAAYDGTEKMVTGYTVESNNTAYTEANIKFSGTAVAKGTVVGTYDMGLNVDQFSNVSDNFTNVEFIVNDGKLTITGGQIDVDGVDWVTQDVQKVYDGDPLSAHEASATDKNGNALKVEYSVDDGKTWVSDPAKVNLTHFGDQTVTLRATGPNYAEGQYATSSESIAIKKRPVTLASEGANKTYDGTALTNDTVTATPKGEGVGFVDGEGVTVTVTGSQTAVGESDNTFTYEFNEGTNAADYQVTSKYGKLIVTADDTEVVVTITGNSKTEAYDGTEKTVEGYDFKASNSLYTQADFEFSGNATVSGTDAGTYDMQLKAGDFKNTSASFSKVTFVVVDGTLTITPKDIVPTGDNGMTVGTLPDVVYNGQPQRQAPVVKDRDKTLVEGEDYELSYSADETGADVTNAGTVTVTVTGKGNYTGKFDVTYQILKRQVDLTSGTQTWTYDGKAHSLTVVSGWEQSGDTGFVDGEVADVRATGTVTYVADGKVTNAIAYTELAGFRAENYDITKREGILDVTPVADKVTVTVKGNSKTVAYDGTEKAVTGYTVASISNSLYKQGDFAFSGEAVAKGTVVGPYTMGLNAGQFSNTNANFSNVEFIVEDGTLIIEGGQIDADGVTWYTSDVEKMYDGTPLSANRASARDKHGNALTVEYSLDGKTWVSDPAAITATNVGDSAAVQLRATGSNYAEGQYAFSSEKVGVTMRPVYLTSARATKPYDGTPLTKNAQSDVTVGGAGFVDGEGATYNITGSQTLAGESFNEFTYTLNKGTLDENYFITRSFGKLIVTANDSEVVVTITEHSGTFAYDGTEKTVEGYDFEASNPLYTQADFEFSGNATVSGTAAGTYNMELKAGDFKNTAASFSKVTFVVVDGTLTITPKDIKPAEGNGMTVGTLPDVVYNGTEQAQKPVVKDGDKTLVEGTDYELSYSADITNAGTVTVTVTGKGNYAGKAQVTYQILKRQVELTSGSLTWPYDGKAHSLTEVGGWQQSGDKGFVDGEIADVRATGTVTYVADGKVTNAIAYTELAGFRAGNYEITKHEGTLEVTPATGKVVVTITERGGSYTYDGTEKSAEGYDFVASDPLYTQADFDFTGDATVRGTDAGTYEMQLKSSDFANTNANFAEVEFVVVDSELTIAKRTVTLTSADGAKVYDGIALTKNEQSDVTVTGGEGFVAGETLAYEISGTQTVVGSSENTFVATSSETAKVDNYDVTYVYGTLTVSAQSIVPDPENPDTHKGVTVDDPVDSVYDGQQHKWLPVVTDAEGNALVEGEDYTVSYDKDDFTNVTGDITVTITGMGNYSGTVTKTYKITKAPLAVAALSASKVYDGSALTAGGTIDGLIADETAQAVTSGSQTEVGSSANVVDSIAWGTALESNYYIASQTDGTLTVTPKGIAPEPGNGMTVGTLPDVVYNGSEQAQKPTVKDGDTELVEGVDYDLTYSEDLTNAGTVTVTVTGKGNYAGSVDVTYQITPAALTVSTPSASKVYDGEALAAEGTVSGFVAGESAPFATTGSQTLVGSSTNTYAIDWAAEGATAKQSNYVVSEELGTLTVTETTDEIVATPASYTGVYDGSAHGVNVTVTGLPKGYSVKSAISHAQATDVTGDAPVVANVDELVIVNAQGEDVTANLNIQKGTGTIAITPATLTVTTPSASKAYDGCALTAEGKVSGFVAGESATLVTTGSQTLVGTSNNTYELNWDGNANAANYEIVENIGTLEVTQSQAAIVIVPQGASKTYDGTPLEAAGYDVYGLPAGFTLTAVVKGSQTSVGGSYAEVDSYVIENAAGEDVTDQFANVSCGMATLSVAKRPVTITSADATQVYNGAELTAHEATVTAGEGIVEGETLEYEFFGSQIPVGSSQNTFVARSGEGTDVDNYDITYVYGTLTVTPKGIAPEPGNGMTVGTLPDVVYNGSEQAQKPTVKDGDTELVEGVDYDLTYSEDLTNAGTVTVTVTGKGNYAGSVDVTYQITPAALTVSTPSASKVYDGEALAAEGTVSGFVAGESAPFATTGSQTLVGSSTNTYAIDWAAEGATAKQSNYVISEELGTLTVTDGTDDDPVDPSLVINKTHEDGTYALGDTVDFTLTATNVYGEARTMTFVEQEGVEIIGQTVFENVAPGTTVSTTARYTVTEADILAGGFTNTATVTFEGGKAFDGKDDVVVEKVENALEVTKTIGSTPADGVSFNEGETVSFVVTVTNKGNQTLKDVQVTDKLAGAFLAQGESDLIESLAPGETVTLHYGYTITANDLGKEFRNVAVATAGNGTTGEGESPVIPVAPMSPEPNPDQKPDSKPGSGKPAIPKTADETPDGLMAALANLGLASLAAGLACLFVIPRRREN